MQRGYIKACQIQREEGLPFEQVKSIELEAEKGIIGDCHGKGGEKQIALISSKAKQWITEQELQGLCLSRFQENIVTEGMDFSLLIPGSILKTDDVMIEITIHSKKCFSECRLILDKLSCELKTGIRFGKVIKSGAVRVGDEIWVN